MPSLASGLMQGLTAVMKSRERNELLDREDNEIAYRRAQAGMQQQRQARLDAQQQTMMSAQLEQMKAAQAEREAARTRQGELDQRSAFEGGYRPQSEVARTGEGLQGAGAMLGALPGMAGGGDSLGNVGDSLTARAKGPSAFTLSGIGMVKGGQSVREQEQAADAQQRAGERITAAEQRAAELAQQQKFTAGENDKNRRNATAIAGMNNATRLEAGSHRGTPQGFTAARQLRGEFEKEIKPHRETATALADIAASANAKPSAQGDIALTYKFMKALDPTSTVREGEYATAKNAGGIPDRIRNMFNQARDGRFLTPEQRQEMLRAAQERATAMHQLTQRSIQRYSALAEKYGLDPADVVFDPFQPETPKDAPVSQVVTPLGTAPAVKTRPPLDGGWRR